VDLNNIKPSLHSPLRSIRKRLLEGLNVVQRHLLGIRMFLVPGDRARGIYIVWPAIEILPGNLATAQPRSDGGCLPTSMGKLDHDLLALAVGEVDHLLERRDLAVLPETDILGCDAALRSHGGGFDGG